MLNLKKTILACFLLVFLIMGTVSASDDSDILQNFYSDDNTLGVNDAKSEILTDSADSSLIYVDIAGSDSNAGNSTHPYATINKAISIIDDSKDTIIYLGEGTFNDEGNINLEINLANIARGGSLSIIGVSGKTIIDGQHSYRVIKSVGSSSIVSIKNIIFNNTESPNYEQGGAIYSQGYLTIENCVFENSVSPYSSGGAVFQNGGNFTSINSIFKNDFCEREGGAILAYSQYIEIINNAFINCTGGTNTNGAAIYAYSQFASKINRNKFYNISVSGWARDASMYSWSNNAEIINNTFENCNNYGTIYAVMYVGGLSYLSGNRFINSSSISKGYIFNNGKMNLIIKINNVSTTSPNFSLTANITDIDGNPISYDGWPWLNFYLNDSSIGTTRIINGVAKLDVAKLLDNGIYAIDIVFDNAINSTWSSGILNVNINRIPIDLWVDSINGNDVEDGGGESNPFKSLSYAINQGLSQSIYPTIHIKNGLYCGENNTNIAINDLVIINIVGESSNETIIDGEYLNPIFIIGENTISTIKNISFINAKSTSYGGAITSEGSLTVDNCIFKDNIGMEYSGAIYFGNGNVYSNLTITNCKFINCTTNHYSASVYTQNSNNIIFKNNVISNCSSKYNNSWNLGYGSVLLKANNVIVSNNSFINNSAINTFVIDLTVEGKGVIDNNSFINSSAYSSRSVLYVNCDGKVTNNGFYNSQSDLINPQAGTAFIGGNVFLKNNTFINTTQFGSNIYVSGGTIINLKIIILNNQSITINNHLFNLTANVMDTDGNLITVNPDLHKYLYFYIDGENIGKTNHIKDGLATLECYKYLDNGLYHVGAAIDIASNVTVIPATLIVNITSNSKKYYISDSIGNDEEGDGSRIKPFKTIKKALYQSYTIDKSYNVTIIILDGIYSGEGNVNLSLNNSCAGFLKIIGNDYNKTIIDGNNKDNLFKYVNAGIPNTLKLIFENITFINFSSYNSFIMGEASELFFNNCIFNSIYSRYIVIDQTNDLTINNCIFNNVISADESIIGTYDDIYYYAIFNSTFRNCNARVAIIYSVNELNYNKFINCTTYGRDYDEYSIVVINNNMTLLNNVFINNTAVASVLKVEAPVTILNNTFI